MASIPAKNTSPELKIRKSLHRRGYRYRLHSKLLPGKPDLVFSQLNAVIFINGCFWHGHDCHLFRMPSSNNSYWSKKIDKNKKRDIRNGELLVDMNWRVLTIWECSLKGKGRLEFELLISTIENWLHGDSQILDIRGVTDSRNSRREPKNVSESIKATRI